MATGCESGSGLAEEDEKKPLVPSTHINIKVNRQDGIEVWFRIKRNTPLKKLINAYCDKHSAERNSIVFLIDGHGFRNDQTPDELEMEDGDEIDAMLHQDGGGM